MWIGHCQQTFSIISFYCSLPPIELIEFSNFAGCISRMLKRIWPLVSCFIIFSIILGFSFFFLKKTTRKLPEA